MSQLYFHLPEVEMKTRIERLELDARDIRRRVEHARNIVDKRALNRQLEEIKQDLLLLRHRIP